MIRKRETVCFMDQKWYLHFESWLWGTSWASAAIVELRHFTSNSGPSSSLSTHLVLWYKKIRLNMCSSRSKGASHVCAMVVLDFTSMYWSWFCSVCRILDVSRFVLQISCWFDEHNGTRQMSAPLLFPPLQKISSNCRTISPVWLSGLELSTNLLLFGLHLEVKCFLEFSDYLKSSTRVGQHM